MSRGLGGLNIEDDGGAPGGVGFFDFELVEGDGFDIDDEVVFLGWAGSP